MGALPQDGLQASGIQHAKAPILQCDSVGAGDAIFGPVWNGHEPPLQQTEQKRGLARPAAFLQSLPFALKQSLLLPVLSPCRQRVLYLRQSPGHPDVRGQRSQQTARHLREGRPRSGKSRVTGEPLRHLAGQSDDLSLVPRAFQPEQQCREGIAPCQIVLAERAFIHQMIAQARLPSPGGEPSRRPIRS